MELTRGLRHESQRIVMYGPEGIGKSTLASQLPSPVFIDVEGSTSDLDVMRTPTPSSWRALVDTANEFVRDHHGRETLVIDTADWAEKLCIAHICSVNSLTALGGQNDFGHSYNLLDREWRQFLDSLSRVASSGMHVCLTAHTGIRKCDLLDQMASYDKYELKMEKKTATSTKEWARCVLFLNYKVYAVVDKSTSPKAKGTGGHRVIYTSSHPAREAKNRIGMKDELKMEYASIAALFTSAATPFRKPPKPVAEAAQEPEPEPKPEPKPEPAPASELGDHYNPNEIPSEANVPAHLLPLLELAKRDGITEHEIQLAVARRGYRPVDMPLANYDESLVAGKLVALWPQVVKVINSIRQEAMQ